MQIFIDNKQYFQYCAFIYTELFIALLLHENNKSVSYILSINHLIVRTFHIIAVQHYV
jgi:hypothetical protein